MYRLIVILVIFGAAISGCMDGNDEKQSQTSPNIQQTGMKTEVADQSPAGKAKKQLKQMEDIENAKAVNTEKSLIIAVKVTGFDRFRLQELHKKIESDMNKMFPGTRITITSDKKVYMKLEDLEKQIQKGQLDKKTLNKKLKDLKNVMKVE
jgi:hypothetical protein